MMWFSDRKPANPRLRLLLQKSDDDRQFGIRLRFGDVLGHAHGGHAGADDCRDVSFGKIHYLA